MRLLRVANHVPSPPSSLTISQIAPCTNPPRPKRKWRQTMSGKAVLENVRRYRTIASLYRQTAAFRPDQNGRSWRKHLSMSVSRGRSSKDTLLFRGGTWQPLRKAVKGNTVKLSPNKTDAIVRGFHLVTLFGPTRTPHLLPGHVRSSSGSRHRDCH